MKKVIYTYLTVAIGIILIISSVVLGVQFHKHSNNKTANNIYVTHSGFESHEDLANAYINAMILGNSDELIGLMNKQMISSIATENYTTVESITSGLLSWYNSEQAYYLQWIDEEFPYASSISWNISEMYWYEDNYFKELPSYADYELGIAGYDYYSLCRDGATKVLCYRASIDVTDSDNVASYGFEFAVALFGDTWYLLGFD